MFLVINFQ